jgi:hypothetical protein
MLFDRIPEVQICMELYGEMNELRLKLEKERESAIKPIGEFIERKIHELRTKDATTQMARLLGIICSLEYYQFCLPYCGINNGEQGKLPPLVQKLADRLHELYVENGSGPCGHPVTYGRCETCAVCGLEENYCPD